MAPKPYVLAHTTVPPHVRVALLRYSVGGVNRGLEIDNNILTGRQPELRFSAATKDLLRGLGEEFGPELAQSGWVYFVEPIQKIAFILNSMTWARNDWPGLREWCVKCSGEESDLLVFFDWLLERVPSIEHDPFLFALSTDKWRRKSAGTFHRFLTRGNGSLYDAFGEGLEMPHDDPRYVEYAFVARENHKQGFMLRTEHRDPSVWHLDVTPEVDPATLRRFVAWFQRRLGRVKAMVKFMSSRQR